MPPVVELQQVRGGGLRGVDLRVAPEERVGVVGLPGSGSSSIAPLVAGTLDPDAGRVVREGRDVTGRAVGDRPGGLGWVARAAQPFSRLSVYENVLVAALANRRWRRRLAEAHARRAVIRLGLGELADALAGDLDAECRCRLEVARAVAAPRRLVLVDHLAEGLAPGLRAELALAVGEVAATGTALLWVDTVDRPPSGVDRLVVLAQGRIVADGARDDIIAGGELRSLLPQLDGPLRRALAVPPDAAVVFEARDWRPLGIESGASLGGPAMDIAVGEGELVLASSGVPGRPAALGRSLAGLAPAEGELLVGGVPLDASRARSRAARGLGYVPSTGGLDLSSTVADHLALGRATGRRGPWSASAVLAILPELAPLRAELVGELVALERRLTSIGRALAGNPLVLVVEDPLADLDERGAVIVTDALVSVARRTPVLVLVGLAGPLAARASRVVDLDVSPPSSVRSAYVPVPPGADRAGETERATAAPSPAGPGPGEPAASGGTVPDGPGPSTPDASRPVSPDISPGPVTPDAGPDLVAPGAAPGPGTSDVPPPGSVADVPTPGSVEPDVLAGPDTLEDPPGPGR